MSTHVGRATYVRGAWRAKSSTTTCTDYVAVDGRLLYSCVSRTASTAPGVEKASGVRCHRSRSQLTSSRRIATTPRSKPTTYRKRVTWFSNLPGGDNKAVAEYHGVHLGTSLPHGNAKHINRLFVRTHPETLRRVDDKVKHRQPRNVSA